MKPLGQLIIGISLCVITPIVALAEIPEKDLKAANEGDAEAMFMVGSGYLLERNMPEAFSWLEKAVAKNHSAAKAALGFMYYQGFACEVDQQKARSLYEESAKEGSHQGLNNLAHLYRFGVAGIKKDTKKAYQIFSKATAGGSINAAINLAVLQYQGVGCPQDQKAAKELMTKLAKTGAIDAARILKAWEKTESGK